jgi:hypothetical protein
MRVTVIFDHNGLNRRGGNGTPDSIRLELRSKTVRFDAKLIGKFRVASLMTGKERQHFCLAPVQAVLLAHDPAVEPPLR